MSESPSSAEIRALGANDAEALGDFFEAIRGLPEVESYFTPHPLDRAQAVRIATRAAHREDEYFAAFEDGRVVAYGMLRGWDEGYPNAAFGVAVLPERRGAGLGRAILRYAVERARAHGAERVVLKVNPENVNAMRLYESEGFVFDGYHTDGEQLLAHLDL